MMERRKRKREIGARMKRRGYFWKTAVLLGTAMCFTACGGIGQRDAEETLQEARFFAYTDEENGLYLWEQGAEEPVLLTQEAFAMEEEWAGGMRAAKEAAGESGAAREYWEEWEYWQEWDDHAGQWVWNHEKALAGIVKEPADHIYYFPQRMRWKSFCMTRSTGELEDAQKYTKGEDTASCAGVRMFLFDLYCRDTGGMEEEAAHTERIAENICFYHLDKRGNVWYCKAEENGTGEVGGVTYPFAGCMLYRYDGEEHLKIAEINGRRKEAFRVSRDGEYVIFYALDDGLYGCKPGEEADLLAEETDVDMFADADIYTDADIDKIIYAEGSTIHIIEDRERKEERQITGTKDYLMTGILGEEGDRVFTLAMEEEGSYAGWLVREETKEDEDTKRLWELIEKSSLNLYAVLCHASLMDISSGQAECVETKEGYLLSWPDSGGMEKPRKVYYIEMIPADAFEKFTLSELFGKKTPAEVLEACEDLKNDAYYKEKYGDRYEEYAVAEALDSCVDREALKKRAMIYAVTANGIQWIEEADSGNILVDGDYGEEDTDILYLRLYRHMEQGKDGSYGYPSYYYYSYLEDRYALDREGNCEKVVEAADETAVKGNEVFYSRTTGLGGAVSLFRSGFDGPMAKAVSISMESIVKSRCSDGVLFLVDGFLPEEEDVYVEAERELLQAYRALARDREWYEEEAAEQTLVLHDGNGAKVLENEVYRYGFFAGDSVWIMQYEDKGKGLPEDQDNWYDEEERSRKRGGRLWIYENGEKKQIAERAVWMVVPEAGGGSGRIPGNALWRYE